MSDENENKDRNERVLLTVLVIFLCLITGNILGFGGIYKTRQENLDLRGDLCYANRAKMDAEKAYQELRKRHVVLEGQYHALEKKNIHCK